MSQPTKEQLEEAYARLRSSRAVAHEMGVAPGSISKLLKEAGKK